MKGEIQGWQFLVEVNLCGIKLRQLSHKFLKSFHRIFIGESRVYM